MSGNYEYVERGVVGCWLHKKKPVWIVFYDVTFREPFYQAYQAIESVKHGAMPWSANNKALSQNGFRSLDEAMAAGDAV